MTNIERLQLETKVNNSYHERSIITEQKFSRGSIIDYKALRYLILSDTMEKKYGKYFKGNILDIEVIDDLELKEYNTDAKEIEGYILRDTSSKIVVLTRSNPRSRD